MPVELPRWISPELISLTVRTLQPLSSGPISQGDAVATLVRVGHLIECVIEPERTSGGNDD
jgi:hypothetical protein